MNHTPTPWKADKYGQVLTDPSSGCYETIATTPKAWIDNKIFNQDCKPEAITMLHEWSERAQANAMFIAAACNAHEELVEALEKAQAVIGDLVRYGNASDDETEAYENIKQALTLAKKGA